MPRGQGKGLQGLGLVRLALPYSHEKLAIATAKFDWYDKISYREYSSESHRCLLVPTSNVFPLPLMVPS